MTLLQSAAQGIAEGISPDKPKRDSSYLEENWREWLQRLFSPYVTDDYGEFIGFAEHHEEFWEWLWAIERGKRPHPYIAIWPRGGAKSTNAEMATVALAARGIRRYGLYVCGTQDQADDHVQNIADMLEGKELESYYPELASRMVGKFGNYKGWRRNRLRTSSGFTVDAIGLDRATRGVKLEEARPDFIVLDDLDSESDTEETVEKKIRALTRKIIPAGARDLAVLAVQNLVHPNSIFSHLADGSAKFLADRHVSGPIPALRDAVYADDEIIQGIPVWEGQSLTACREMARDMGISAFRVECQQEVEELAGTIIKRAWFEGEPTYHFEDQFEHINEAIPQRNRYQLGNYYLRNLVLQRWVSYDTAFKDKDVNDPTGIVVWERLGNGILLVRYAEEVRLTVPEIEDRIKEDFRYWDFDNKLVGMVIEDKGSGIGILQTLKRVGRGITNYSGRKTLSNSLIPFDPKQDSKEFRARQASVWLRRDCVWLPEQSLQTPWLPVFEDRLFKFPFSKTKDMVDAFTQFILYSEPRIQKGWETRSGFYKQAAEEKRKRKLEYESRAV